MTFEEAKKIFLNRGYVEVDGGTIFDGDKWRQACVVISDFLEDMKEPKTGYWIADRYTDTDIRYNDVSYCCSICDEISDFDTEYCPNCGAKMVDPRESEE